MNMPKRIVVPVAHTAKYKELTDEIEQLLLQPLPPPAEKHLLRERILELQLRRMEEVENLTDDEKMQLAVDFTLEKVPQRIVSYPMHLREVCMAPIVRPAIEYPARPGTRPSSATELRSKLEALLAKWRSEDSQSRA